MVKAWAQLGADVKVRDRGGEGEGCKKLTWRIHRGVTADVRGKARRPMGLGNGPGGLDLHERTFHEKCCASHLEIVVENGRIVCFLVGQLLESHEPQPQTTTHQPLIVN
jgi:hypothetical protein